MPQPSLGKSRGSCQKRSSREMGGRRSQRAGITDGAKNHRKGPQEKHCNWTRGGGKGNGGSRRKLGNTNLP